MVQDSEVGVTTVVTQAMAPKPEHMAIDRMLEDQQQVGSDPCANPLSVREQARSVFGAKVSENGCIPTVQARGLAQPMQRQRTEWAYTAHDHVVKLRHYMPVKIQTIITEQPCDADPGICIKGCPTGAQSSVAGSAEATTVRVGSAKSLARSVAAPSVVEPVSAPKTVSVRQASVQPETTVAPLTIKKSAVSSVVDQVDEQQTETTTRVVSKSRRSKASRKSSAAQVSSVRTEAAVEAPTEGGLRLLNANVPTVYHNSRGNTVALAQPANAFAKHEHLHIVHEGANSASPPPQYFQGMPACPGDEKCQ